MKDVTSLYTTYISKINDIRRGNELGTKKKKWEEKKK